MKTIFTLTVIVIGLSVLAPIGVLGAGIAFAVNQAEDPCNRPQALRPPWVDCPPENPNHPGTGPTLPASKDRATALKIAAEYAGVPYRWGGTDPRTGLDCSGYSQLVMRRMGITIPRTSRQQQSFLPQTHTPLPGDLVFFEAPVSHVGIYAGNGMMWHAPRRNTVVQKSKVWTHKKVRYGRVPYPPPPTLMEQLTTPTQGHQ